MSRNDLYNMNINCGRNCYSCGGFGHLTKNCINWGIVKQGRRMEYGDNCNTRDNLKEEESLVVLN